MRFRSKGKQEADPADSEALYEEKLWNDYGACFGGPAGDEVLKDLIGITGIHTSSFKAAEFDPVKAAFFDGMKYVVQRLLGYSGRKLYDL